MASGLELDRLVALAPNPQAGIVTSEPLTAVEVDRDSMVVSTTDGREVTAAEREIAKLTPDANAEHLEHIQARNAERAAGRDRGLDL